MKKVFKQIIFGVIVAVFTIIITFILRENFFKFDKKINKENKQIIEEYITEINNSHSNENMTFLSTYYFGDRYNDDKLEIFLWIMYDEYIDTENSFERNISISIPCVVTIDIANDEFNIIDYKIPEEGNLYKKSINKLFPLAIRGKVKNFINSKEYDKLLNEHENLVETYQEYFKGE